MAGLYISHNTEKYPELRHLPSLKQKPSHLRKSSCNAILYSASKQKHRVSHLRNSKILERPTNPMLNQEEFTRKCKKLWTKFDSRVSPILQKYKFSSLINRKLVERKPDFLSGRVSERLRNYRDSFVHEEESYEQGIQCEISSDGSDDIKVNISKYVNYVNL